MGSTADTHKIYQSHFHQKDGAPVESIPFALKKMFPTPTAFCDIVVTNVMLLLRNGVLGSTGPVHLPISLCFMKVYRPALCPPCSLQRLPLSPTKGPGRLLTVAYRALYVRRGANSWTRFRVTLQLCFFIEILAIVLVGVQKR